MSAISRSIAALSPRHGTCTRRGEHLPHQPPRIDRHRSPAAAATYVYSVGLDANRLADFVNCMFPLPVQIDGDSTLLFTKLFFAGGNSRHAGTQIFLPPARTSGWFESKEPSGAVYPLLLRMDRWIAGATSSGAGHVRGGLSSMMTLFGPLLVAALMARFQGGTLHGTVVDDRGKPAAEPKLSSMLLHHGAGRRTGGGASQDGFRQAGSDSRPLRWETSSHPCERLGVSPWLGDHGRARLPAARGFGHANAGAEDPQDRGTRRATSRRRVGLPTSHLL